MDTLSVVVITRDEEANIGECLESAGFADELVVLDSGSEDRTLEIARRHTDKVHGRAWTGYADQRNAAHELARCDWILALDADERVSPELAAEIRELLAVPRPDVVGYYLLRRVYYRKKWIRHGGFWPVRVLRLFRRGRGRCADRLVHETIEVEGPTGALRGALDHYTYDSVDDYLRRMERYASLSAEEYLRRGRATGPLRMSGHALFTFFQMYILRRGFLDGYEGFLLAVLYSFYTFSKYAKLKELTEGARV